MSPAQSAPIQRAALHTELVSVHSIEAIFLSSSPSSLLPLSFVESKGVLKIIFLASKACEKSNSPRQS